MPTLFGTKVKTKLELPENLYEAYERHGTRSGRSAEEEMNERLKRCRDHTASNPLYFDDKARAELERAVGHVVRSPAIVTAQLANLVTLEIGEVSIKLAPRLVQRLSTRVFRGDTFEKLVAREVVQGLERFAGMRPY